MPYRHKKEDRKRSTHQGIVGDLVAQFADPYAFFRELVQNAIDAGSKRIHVALRFADGVLEIAVRDDGEGMTREVLEEQLLVLFRSGKENLDDKIGKFGVGFISVMAIEPRLVRVRTARGKRTGHTVHLAPDHSYELFEHGGGRRGTTVTLEVPCSDRVVAKHVAASRASLYKWCRHASVPIVFHVDESAGGDGSELRIDSPLGIEGALVDDLHETSDGKTVVAVGLRADGTSKVSFFNHGLTLHESSGEVFPGLVVKILDARLEHTLSRDNVRRDGAYRWAVEHARQVIRRRFVKKVYAALRTAPDRERYIALVSAYGQTSLNKVGFPLRLLHPTEEGEWTVAAAGRHFAARGESPLTEAMAKHEPVVDALAIAPIEGSLRRAGTTFIEDWVDLRDAVVAVPLPDSADALLSACMEQLEAVHRRPPTARFGEVHGRGERSVFVGDPGEAAEAAGDPFAVLKFLREGIVINTAHPTVAAALKASESQPELAASLLTRAVLLADGALNDKRSERMMLDALGELFEPSAAGASD